MAVLSSRAQERRSREKNKLLPPQSPRGFSALARLYYLARPTKTAMLRRLTYPRRTKLDRNTWPETHRSTRPGNVIRDGVKGRWPGYLYFKDVIFRNIQLCVFKWIDWISWNRAVYPTLKFDFIAPNHFPKKSFGDRKEQLFDFESPGFRRIIFGSRA